MTTIYPPPPPEPVSTAEQLAWLLATTPGLLIEIDLTHYRTAETLRKGETR